MHAQAKFAAIHMKRHARVMHQRRRHIGRGGVCVECHHGAFIQHDDLAALGKQRRQTRAQFASKQQGVVGTHRGGKRVEAIHAQRHHGLQTTRGGHAFNHLFGGASARVGAAHFQQLAAARDAAGHGLQQFVGGGASTQGLVRTRRQ